MTGLVTLLFHLLGFSALAGSTFAGWVLSARFVSEPEPELKLAVGRAMRNVSLLFPAAACVVLLTGITLIYVEYTARGVAWLGEPWLIIKVVLFGVLLTNGTVLGPSIARKRLAIVRSVVDGEQELLDEGPMNHLNAQMRWHYVVQTILVIALLSFSLFGPAHHFGAP